jgi:hypothetical protein
VQRQHLTGDRKLFSVHLFGHDSDLSRVDLLFTSLLVQASYALAAQPVPSWENVAAYRRSWLAGYARAVVARLHAAEARAAATVDRSGPSMELVLADRTTLVRKRVAEAYPRARLANPRRLAGSGAAHGYAVGQRADLGSTRVTSRMAAPAVRG